MTEFDYEIIPMKDILAELDAMHERGGVMAEFTDSYIEAVKDNPMYDIIIPDVCPHCLGWLW